MKRIVAVCFAGWAVCFLAFVSGVGQEVEEFIPLEEVVEPTAAAADQVVDAAEVGLEEASAAVESALATGGEIVEGAVVRNDAPAPEAALSEQDGVKNSYQLVALDQIRFKIAEDPKTHSAKDRSLLTVNSLGYIEFPVSQGYPDMIPLLVRGKTIDQVRAEIKARLEAEYYQKATVSLQLLTQNQKPGAARFHGEVKGTVPIEPGKQKTLTQAILELNYDEYANLKKVTVQRINPATGLAEKISVNVKEILDDNKFENDIVLLDGDVVHVPSRGIVF